MNKIEYGTEFLDQLKDSVHELYDEKKELKKEIERLNNELENVKAHYETEAEAKYYEFIDNHESKLQQRIDKVIDLLEESKENIDLPWYDRQHLIEKTINELKGEDNETF